MRGYLTVVLGLAMLSFIAGRFTAIIKAEKGSLAVGQTIGMFLEVAMTIIAIVFTWKI